MLSECRHVHGVSIKGKRTAAEQLDCAGKQEQPVRSCFALNSLHAQTLMLTDVQTLFLGTPLVPSRVHVCVPCESSGAIPSPRESNTTVDCEAVKVYNSGNACVESCRTTTNNNSRNSPLQIHAHGHADRLGRDDPWPLGTPARTDLLKPEDTVPNNSCGFMHARANGKLLIGVRGDNGIRTDHPADSSSRG